MGPFAHKSCGTSFKSGCEVSSCWERKEVASSTVAFPSSASRRRSAVSVIWHVVLHALSVFE